MNKMNNYKEEVRVNMHPYDTYFNTIEIESNYSYDLGLESEMDNALMLTLFNNLDENDNNTYSLSFNDAIKIRDWLNDWIEVNQNCIKKRELTERINKLTNELEQAKQELKELE